LDLKEPFIYKLVGVLTKQMGTVFPELLAQKQLIQNVIKEEEASFLRTLDQGLVLLERIINSTKGSQVSGDKAFELYDTYGFPVDLTALILNEKEMTLDTAAFEAELQKQKNRSRAAGEVSTEDWIVLFEDTEQEFVGYDVLKTSVKITKYRKVTSVKEGTQYQLVFNLTPFYSESGGQAGDKGYLESTNGNIIYVLDTKKENNIAIHVVENLPNNLTDIFTAVVDSNQRFRTECNHTATHLLHQALREVLGDHVEQKGSAVHSKYLRFDFSHFSKITSKELKEVERFVNARIEEKLSLEENRTLPMEQAISDGAIALFGEKYSDVVRTIRFGNSIELCGGTHVKNTADIWHFKIKSEGAVASGIRRIEAITNDSAKEYYAKNNTSFEQVKLVLNNSSDPVKSISDLKSENSKLKKQIESLLKDKALSMKGDLKLEVTLVNGVHFLAKKVDLDASGIKDLSFELGQQFENSLLLFGTEQNGKALLSCYVSKQLVVSKGLNAGTIVRELGRYIEGGGGGQPFYATAGGNNPAGLQQALNKAKSYIE
jgi:alanyl-tRNA synthetase